MASGATAASKNMIPLPTENTPSPIGPLEIKNGYPTDDTVKILYDALDFQRATQAYIWALPYMAMTE